MELVDGEDVETMVALYCGNRSDQNAPCMVPPISYVDNQSIVRGIEIDLNVTLDIDVVGDDGYDSSDPCDHKVDSDSDPDVDEVPDDFDDEGVNDDGNINASSVQNQIRRIVIHNNLRAHMSLINLDMAHTAEFSEYPEILPAHLLAVDSSLEELFLGQRFEKMGQQQINRIEMGYVFVEDVRDAMVANRRMARSMNVEVYSRHLETFRVTETIDHQPDIPPRSYGVNLLNRRCDCRRFQTLHYLCAHVVAACAKVSLNVEQFINNVYTLERALRVWENEFPVLPDLSTGMRNIEEKSYAPKVIDELEPGGVEYCGGYDPGGGVLQWIRAKRSGIMRCIRAKRSAILRW
ncbi:hypothetical protein GOBAR_DD22036 [Gossypium barbadense]|nr:hypothetical protein GOBAR_DD22036 [Gossypium barbadense]